MNDTQKVCLFIGVLAFIALCLNPPWLGKSAADSVVEYVGHRFVLTGPSVSVLDRHAAKTRFGHRPHWTRLGIELSLVICSAAVMVALLRTRRPSA